jgi:hypothetical protein
LFTSSLDVSPGTVRFSSTTLALIAAGFFSRQIIRAEFSVAAQSTTMCESTVWSWTSPLRGQKPKEQIAYCYWLVLSGTSHQSVRALKSVRPLDLHFPIVVCARADDGHPPVSRSVAQDVFNYRLKF